VVYPQIVAGAEVSPFNMRWSGEASNEADAFSSANSSFTSDETVDSFNCLAADRYSTRVKIVELNKNFYASHLRESQTTPGKRKKLQRFNYNGNQPYFNPKMQAAGAAPGSSSGTKKRNNSRKYSKKCN
jgi:hypothetical protein